METIESLIMILLLSILILLVALVSIVFIVYLAKDVIETCAELRKESEQLEQLKRHVAYMYHRLCILILGNNFSRRILDKVSTEICYQFEEMERRREKRCNVIMLEVPETGARDLDEAAVNDIIRTCDERAFRVCLFDRFGIGSRNSPRPIRVKLSSPYRKAKVINGVSKLAEHEVWADVRIIEDLTPMQERQQHEQQRGFTPSEIYENDDEINVNREESVGNIVD